MTSDIDYIDSFTLALESRQYERWPDLFWSYKLLPGLLLQGMGGRPESVSVRVAS